jgi:hypothetical protein
MSPVKYKIIHKRIHSPEADALADSFARAAGLVRAQTDELTRVAAELDANWEGQQQLRFTGFLPPADPSFRGFRRGHSKAA